MEHFVGLDVSVKEISVCVVDAAGGRSGSRKFRPSRSTCRPSRQGRCKSNQGDKDAEGHEVRKFTVAQNG
jgi:hypothetical protein